MTLQVDIYSVFQQLVDVCAHIDTDDGISYAQVLEIVFLPNLEDFLLLKWRLLRLLIYEWYRLGD